METGSFRILMIKSSMKQSSYKLKIENPCSEDWGLMAKCDDGKFCSHCSKMVIDFTRLTDDEILKMLSKNSGNVCGRLDESQMNRILVPSQQPSQSRIYRILAGLLLLASSGKLSAAGGRPQTEMVSKVDEADTVSKIVDDNVKKSEDKSCEKNILHGRVIDAQDKEPISFANVIIKDTKDAVTTDVDGKFQLVVPDSLLSERIILNVSYLGYERAELTINKEDLSKPSEILINLVSQIYTMGLVGEIAIIQKENVWQKVKRKSHKIFSKHTGK